jgi:hypothetical protein
MGDSRYFIPQKMILKKEEFSSIGEDGAQASVGLIYKLLLLHNYKIEDDAIVSDTKYLIKDNIKIAEVSLNDVVYFLHTSHTTYKLYVNRLDKALKSKFERNRNLTSEYENVLRQLEDIYVAKYLFKKLPLTIRIEYLK